jgi:hypothetical protein
MRINIELYVLYRARQKQLAEEKKEKAKKKTAKVERKR